MSQGLTGVSQAAARQASTASATTVTLPNGPMTATYPITGTTTITGITAGQAGRRATLEFQSANCTVVNGSNLKLAGRSFISTALRTLDLESDGTNWIERSRGAFGSLLPVIQNFGDANTAGTSGESADIAHVHGMPNYPSFNALINGDFAFAQTGLTSNPLVSGNRNLDDWAWSQAGDGQLWHSQIASVPSIFNGVDLASYSYINVIVARTTSAVSDAYQLYQPIEGWDARHIVNGCTFSGWFNTTQAGTYCFSLRNRAATLAYVHPVTLTANTWTYVTFTFPAIPSASITGNMRENLGFYFTICLGAGSNWQTTADAWNAGNVFATSAQTNFPAVPSAQFFMHALNLIPGPYAQPFVPLPYEQELARVMRHRQVFTLNSGDYLFVAQAISGTQALYSRPFPVQMLGSPTLTVTPIGNFSVLNSTAGVQYPLSVASDLSSLTNVMGSVTAPTAGLVAGNATLIYRSGPSGTWTYESYPT